MTRDCLEGPTSSESNGIPLGYRISMAIYGNDTP